MRWVALFALAACNQVYALDPTDLASAKECSTVRFTEQRPLVELSNMGFVFDGQLDARGTELWYTRPITSDTYDLFRATRPDRESAFEVPTTPTTLLPGTTVFDPAMNADGTRMMIIASSGNRLYEGVRPNPASAFDGLRVVAGVGDFPLGLESIDLSWDGLTLYFTAASGVLYVTHRDDLDAPFDGPRMLFDDVSFPSVSPDEKEIYYSRFSAGAYGQVFRKTRDDRDADFANEEVVFDDAGDPDVSPDAATLVLSTRGGLSLLSRACP